MRLSAGVAVTVLVVLVRIVSAADARAQTSPPQSLEAPRNRMVLRYTPRVVIAWTYDSDPKLGFEVERAILDGVPNARPDRFTKVGTPNRDARSFRDPTSHTGMTYVYRIRAVSAGATSPYSKELIVRVHATR
jgi:hypothetical protein